MQLIDLHAQQAHIKDRLDARIQTVLSHGQYIMGPEVKDLEEKLGQFCGARHAITCANGTDALQLALMAWNIGKGCAVFVPAFTFASSAEVVPQVGAVPFFVDIDPDTFILDVESLKRSIIHARELGLKPAAVMPVDLFGLPADYDAINPIARAEGMVVLGDSAQGFGGIDKDRMTGTLADITTTSFFPAKPLGCYGDGGALFTDKDEWAAMIDSYRIHGKGLEKYENVRIGINSRLDTLQAAILLEKLAIFEGEIEKRNQIAERYSRHLRDFIETPTVPEGRRSVWAQYCLKARNEPQRAALMESLKAEGIPTAIYYPKPLNQQPAYKHFPQDPDGCATSEDIARRIFALPMHPYLSLASQDLVIHALKRAVSAL
ncbi:DegT/DnrJ/EryC1/StrS family aminotransferase [uncultured Cohaesibacter sp.]|uniref:DegT/DnrJ/EryC1/StrS family aminotransferase n=1 Tax=uncultured Cohaesibacter sp. TaxID=1002546 RepID=UPI0029C6DD3A|nr:DegT/DnrJ/EryC1/StrS family aminotransferase [uncultured Cohaesibacter sp.]